METATMTIPVRATVRTDIKQQWIYAGHTLKVLAWREPGDIEKEMGLGREFKLCLKGTEFENKYPGSPYTWIFECDLNIEEEELNDENGMFVYGSQIVKAFGEYKGTGVSFKNREYLMEFMRFLNTHPEHLEDLKRIK